MNDREKLAAWMIRFGFATGHGDTMEQLLDALETEILDSIDFAVGVEREACAMECIKLAHKWTRLGAWGENNDFHECANAIRARSKT